MELGEKPTKLHELVAECASGHPEQICIIFDSGKGEATEQQSITYAQLWQKVTELKLEFENLSIKEQIVSVLLTDGLSIPSVLMSLLSTSCAFHPMNIEGVQYTAAALRNAGVPWILVHSELVQKLDPLLKLLNGCQVSSEVLSKNGLELFQIKHSSNPGLASVKQNDLAYCITTSGTTSTPKMVYVSHACIVPNIIHLRNIFQLGLNDRVLLTSPLTFDPSIVEIFCTLSSGACLVIVPSDIKRRPEKLLEIIHDRQTITVLQTTPTLLRSVPPSKLQQSLLGPTTSLRVLALGGEMFPTKDVLRGWLHPENSKTQFYNLYGITEVSCWASCQDVNIRSVLQMGDPVSIGGALDVTIIKLVPTNSQADIIGSGDEGDIWIGSEKRICFIDNEIHEHQQETSLSMVRENGGILWRSTGDRGKLLPDGSIVCLGRRDDQVKRQGKRLNLEAIEMVCKEFTDVLDCCAILDQSTLMVFIITNSSTGIDLKENFKHTTADSSISNEISLEPPENTTDPSLYMLDTSWTHLLQRLKAHIQECLPSHYVPSVFVKIPGSFPLTLNGKLDKKLLINIGNLEMAAGFERKISNVWTFAQELWMTCLPDSSVCIHCTDNFISLGGDSLAAVRLVSIVEHILKYSLPMLLDLLINKDFGNFVDGLQRYVNIKQPDIQSIPPFLELRKNISESLGNNNMANNVGHKYDQEEGNLDEIKPILNIHFTSVANKDLHNKRLKSSSNLNKISERKISKHTDLMKPDEANLTGDEIVICSSVSISEHHHHENCELHLQPDNDNLSISDSKFRNGKYKSLFNTELSSVAEKFIHSTTLKRIVSRGTIWRKNTSNMRQGSRNISCLSDSNISNSCCSGSLKSGDISDRSDEEMYCPTIITGLEMKFRWKFDTNKCVDASPLIVEQNDMMLAFIGSHSGLFSAINMHTGILVWSTNLPDRIESSACCSLCGTYVVVGCYDGYIYMFDVTTGLIVWKFATSDTVKCSPVIDGSTGFVVCGSHDGFLYCLDLNAKECVWKCDLGGGSVFSSPAIDMSARLVYAASLAGRLLCICADSGTVKWIYKLEKPVFSSLCLLGDSVLVGCVDGKLYCITSSGHVEWTFVTRAPLFSTPIVHSSSVLVGSHDRHLYCLSNTGSLMWMFQTSFPVYSTAFACMFCKHVESSREPCSDFQHKSNVSTEFSVHQSIVVTASTAGTIYMLNFQDGKLLSELKLPGEVFSSPVVVDNFVAVGCRDNFVYCLEVT